MQAKLDFPLGLKLVQHHSSSLCQIFDGDSGFARHGTSLMFAASMRACGEEALCAPIEFVALVQVQKPLDVSAV